MSDNKNTLNKDTDRGIKPDLIIYDELAGGCFNCKKYHDKCKARCCQTIPLPKDLWEKNQDKIQRKITHYLPLPPDDDGKLFVTPTTKDGYCCFLGEDLKCKVYEDRPEACREFGTETNSSARCSFQDKNGKERSRQGKRKIEREMAKSHLSFIKRQIKLFSKQDVQGYLKNNLKMMEE